MEWKVEFKEDVEPSDIKWFTHNCAILFVAAMKYFQERNLQFVITSLKSDRSANLKTVSKTHEEGRAFDVRSRHLNQQQIDDCVAYFEKHYKNIGAISYSTMKPAPCVYHNNHFHFQVRKDGSGIIG